MARHRAPDLSLPERIRAARESVTPERVAEGFLAVAVFVAAFIASMWVLRAMGVL